MLPSLVLQVWDCPLKHTKECICLCVFVCTCLSQDLLCLRKLFTSSTFNQKNIIKIHCARPAEPGVLFSDFSLGPLHTPCKRWHGSTLGLLIMSEFWLCFNCCIAEQPQPVSHSCFISRDTFIPQKTGSSCWLLSSTCADLAQGFYSCNYT